MEYGMFTKAGDRKTNTMVNKIAKLPMTTTNKELYAKLTIEMDRIADDGHEEIWDSDCRDQIISTLEQKTNRTLTMYF